MIDIVTSPAYSIELIPPSQPSMTLEAYNTQVVIDVPDQSQVEIISFPTASVEISMEPAGTVEIQPSSDFQIIEVGVVSGGGGGSDILTAVAGENLSGHRIVKIKNSTAYYASFDDPEILGCQLGLTTHAVLAGGYVSVLLHGRFSEPTWNFDPTKSLFLGLNGVIVQTPPTSGICLLLGRPLKPDTIYLDIELPIILT